MPKLNPLPKQPNFPELEESVQQYWKDQHTFEKSVAQRPKDKQYVFYDGPPFATGLPHYGHLLGSTSKDVIPRYWTMKGYRVERVWGWDCHGLPIENMIEKKLNIKGGKKGIEQLGIDTFNQACSAEVLRLDKEWEKIIDRLGRWVDFEHNYKTMDRNYMESVWWGFKQLYEKELVYEGKKVILYCPRCATPLSNFEIAMDNSYSEVVEPSNVYKYPVVGREKTYILAWSTTPWNKIVTPALAVHPDLEYVVVEQAGENYVVARDRLDILTDQPYKEIETVKGSDLANWKFTPHYDFLKPKNGEKIGIVVADKFVTAEEGTGVVTLAVYGEDDYRVMKEHNVMMQEHVDEEGKLLDRITPWVGLDILEVNPLVNAELASRGLVYREDPHTHRVAECYRCSTRLYYAPLPAWFIDIQKLKPELLSQNKQMNWYPSHLKDGRFGKGLETAPDWNISRSRYWGTPMPVWVGTDSSGNSVKRIIESIEELKIWAVNPEALTNLTDIHREFIDDIEVWIDDKKTIKGSRVKEVFDCWVESGSMPFASRHYPFENKELFESTYPAQFVSEYIAQTRAWFYTMHVMSVGIFGKYAVDNTLTTGTILAEDGSKMSKSKNNYPDPMNLINKYGVDSLRLYLMSSPVMKSENLNFSEQDVADIRKRVFIIWWNVFTFYKAFGEQFVKDVTVAPKVTHVMDKWLLSALQTVTKEVTEYMNSYDVVKASRTLMSFVNEISTWYLRRSRDRVRSDETPEAAHTLGYTLYRLAQLFAPFTPFFSEITFHNIVKKGESVHLTDWPADSEKSDQQLEANMQILRKIVEKVLAQRSEASLKVRQPLASVAVQCPYDELEDDLLDVLKDEVNIKEITWQKKGEGITVTLDTNLSPELQAEGEARELIRNIQKLRRTEGLKIGEKAIVELPSWPKSWQDHIETKTQTQLVKGENIQITT